MASVAVESLYHPVQYDPRAVDALPGLEEAAAKLKAAGFDEVSARIRDIFLRHGVNHQLCLRLLHRHFDVAHNEKIVSHGLVDSPWELGINQTKVLGGEVLPKSWRVYEGELKPYEFRFIAKREVASTPRPVFPLAFVKELMAVLADLELDDTLGVEFIDQKDDEQPGSDVELMEVTFGRSSVMIPVPDSLEGQSSFQASWTFVTKADAPDGVHTRHGVCVARQPADDGVETRHFLCIDRQPAHNGVETRHFLCIDRQPADDGDVKT